MWFFFRALWGLVAVSFLVVLLILAAALVPLILLAAAIYGAILVAVRKVRT